MQAGLVLRLDFDEVGLLRGHDLVNLAGEHGEVLAGFSLALFEGLFGRQCIGGVVQVRENNM